jgi:hypothetical protein
VAGFGLLLALTGVGCGGVGNVSGKVTYDGKAVTYGTVVVYASDGRPVYAEIQKDGTYDAQNVATGETKFTVHSPDPSIPQQDLKKRGGGDSDRKPEDPKPTPAGKKWFPIPGKYGDPLQSGLSLKVVRGNNPFDIDLK